MPSCVRWGVCACLECSEVSYVVLSFIFSLRASPCLVCLAAETNTINTVDMAECHSDLGAVTRPGGVKICSQPTALCQNKPTPRKLNGTNNLAPLPNTGKDQHNSGICKTEEERILPPMWACNRLPQRIFSGSQHPEEGNLLGKTLKIGFNSQLHRTAGTAWNYLVLRNFLNFSVVQIQCCEKSSCTCTTFGFCKIKNEQIFWRLTIFRWQHQSSVDKTVQQTNYSKLFLIKLDVFCWTRSKET